MIIVCPYCGPESLAYVGRVVSIPCANCKSRIAEWENGTNKPKNYNEPPQKERADGR